MGADGRLQSPSRFSCDVDTGRQGPTSPAKSGRPCGLPSALALSTQTSSPPPSEGAGPWEQWAHLPTWKHPTSPSQPPGDQGASLVTQSCPCRQMQLACDLRACSVPLPRSPPPSPSGVHPQPPPHFPRGPSPQPRHLPGWAAVCSAFPTPQGGAPSHQGEKGPSRQPLRTES